VTSCLLRGITRSGKRGITDLAAYASAAFSNDPDAWRTIAVLAADNDGHVPDDEGWDILASNGARARGEDYDAWTDQDFWDEHGQHEYLDLRRWDESAA
jgi:hypothetical protein